MAWSAIKKRLQIWQNFRAHQIEAGFIVPNQTGASNTYIIEHLPTNEDPIPDIYPTQHSLSSRDSPLLNTHFSTTMSTAWTINEKGELSFPSSPVDPVDWEDLDTPVRLPPVLDDFTDLGATLQVPRGLIKPRFFFPDREDEGMRALDGPSLGNPAIDTTLLLAPPPQPASLEMEGVMPGSLVPVEEETIEGSAGTFAVLCSPAL
jgi:hypothetical protein